MRSEVAERILESTPPQVKEKVRGKGHNLVEFVNSKQGLGLKELGYNVPAYAKFLKGKFQYNSLGSPNNYNDGSYGKNIISAPQSSQVFDWALREHNFLIQPQRTLDSLGDWYYFSIDTTKRHNVCEGDFNLSIAKSKCIDKLIKILKSKK